MIKKKVSKKRNTINDLGIKEWPDVKIELGGLNPFKYNPRIDDIPDQLEDSMINFGQLQPIVFNKRNNVIIGGHKRYQILCKKAKAKYNGQWNKVIIKAISVDLSKDDEKAANLALNKIGSNLDMWDVSKLSQLFNNISLDYNLCGTGFSVDEIDNFKSMRNNDFLDDNSSNENKLNDKEKEKEQLIPVKQDKIPETLDYSVTKKGDLWVCGKHKVLCGDSSNNNDVAALMDNKLADMILTDLPLFDNITNDDYSGFIYNVLQTAYQISIDKMALLMFYPICYTDVIFKYLNKSNFDFRSIIIWNQINVGIKAIGYQYKNRYETCVYAYKNKKVPYWFGDNNSRDLIDIPIGQIYDNHPQSKPLELLSKLIPNHTKKDNIVVDLFGGSGSTLMVCEQQNRKCYTMEIEPKYCDMSVKRWQDFTGKNAKHIKNYLK